MSPNRLPDKLLKELIIIGLSGDFIDLESKLPKYLPVHLYLHHLDNEIVDYFSILSDKEIAALIKILVEAENHRLYAIGSMTQIFKMFIELRNRGYEDTDNLEEWAFQHTKSYYVPFDHSRICHAESVKDYLRCRDEYIKGIIQREADKIIKKEETRRIKAKRYAEQRSRQMEVSNKRKVIIEGLNKIDPVQRLAVIAKDAEHPPYFYPSEFACLSENHINELPDNIKELLLLKLKSPPRGNWKKLVNSLA